jgi:uncharacterized caspase-like protein
MRRMILPLAAILLLACGRAEAAEDRRIALIIGNDSYNSLPRLNNAANDARAMDRSLKELGFETIVKVNAGRREMNGAIADFGGRLASGAVGLFYYAGHGIQSDGRNFLVPVDAQLETDVDLDSDGIDADRVLKSMENAHNRLNIVVLDACRDNPLPKKGRSAARGLAVVGNTPGGSLVAYAAGPNQQAQDGEAGGNGVYAAALVEALAVPGLKIEDVFKRTADAVRSRTGGKQQPWQLSSVSGDYYFRALTGGAMAAPPSASPPVVSGGANQAELLFWQSIQGNKNEADFKAYLQQFPSGTFAGLARNRLEALKGVKMASVTPTTVVPKPGPVLEALDREMVAGRKASVRDVPEVRGKLVSTLEEGATVLVTGKVKGENWYAVARKGQLVGYVVTETLEEPWVYKARQEKDAEQRQQMAALAPASAPAASSWRLMDSNDRPLVAIRFDRPNVNYEGALYSAVKSALERRPNSVLEVVAVSPSTGTQGSIALGETAARHNADAVARSLSQMGLPQDRIRSSTASSPTASSGEVQVFVR